MSKLIKSTINDVSVRLVGYCLDFYMLDKMRDLIQRYFDRYGKDLFEEWTKEQEESKATDKPNRAKTKARTNMKMVISLIRLAEFVRFTEDRNIILIPIEQGSTNPIRPKTNGRIITE